MRVAFLGLGRMGAAMAGHVLDAGHELVVWNRSPGRADDLLARGAGEASSPREAAAGADAVVLMLFGPDSVREVLPDLLAGTAKGTPVVNATTVGPQDARELAAACRDAGARYVDAPVAGSVVPAMAGTLGVLVGAGAADLDDVRPLLELWGDPDRIRHVGEVGAGSALKLCLNQGLGVVAAGVGESLRLGRDLGLDRTVLLDALGGAAYGWFLGQKRPMLEADDYGATTFSVELMAKDLELATRASDGDLAVTAAALQQARRAVDAGHSGEDYAVIAGHVADEGEADSY